MTEHQFRFGQTVYADNDTDLRMVVTGITYRPSDVVYVECSYFFNGDQKVISVEAWRLRSFGEARRA